jgi:hypothetical protein
MGLRLNATRGRDVKAHQLIGDFKRYCARAYALDADGKNVRPWEPAAVRWGVTGAMQLCYRYDSDDYKERMAVVRQVARARFSHDISIVENKEGYEAALEILKDLDF